MNLALKAKYSFYSALVFFLVANPETYKVLQKVLGGMFDVATSSGVPTILGFLLQTVIFFFVMLALMMFPRD